MNKFFILLTFTFYITTFSQKLYIWCPPEQKAKPRTSFLIDTNIDVVIFDGRVFPDKIRDKCNAETVRSGIGNYIKNLYPSANVNIMTEDFYYKKADVGHIVIKVAIVAYHAGFGTDISLGIGSIGGQSAFIAFPKGEWNALTSYHIEIIDQRNNLSKKFVKEISELDSKPNMLGYSSAKSALNKTYLLANQKLALFIDSSLME